MKRRKTTKTDLQDMRRATLHSYSLCIRSEREVSNRLAIGFLKQLARIEKELASYIACL